MTKDPSKGVIDCIRTQVVGLVLDDHSRVLNQRRKRPQSINNGIVVRTDENHHTIILLPKQSRTIVRPQRSRE